MTVKIRPKVVKTFYSNAQEAAYKLVRNDKNTLTLYKNISDTKGIDNFVSIAKKETSNAYGYIEKTHYNPQDGSEIANYKFSTSRVINPEFNISDKSIDANMHLKKDLHSDNFFLNDELYIDKTSIKIKDAISLSPMGKRILKLYLNALKNTSKEVVERNKNV